MTITCGYRIYPAWRGFDGNPWVPMREAGAHAAKQMGRIVLNIEKTGSGFDERSGYYVDFKITYSSTETMQEARND